MLIIDKKIILSDKKVENYYQAKDLFNEIFAKIKIEEKEYGEQISYTIFDKETFLFLGFSSPQFLKNKNGEIEKCCHDNCTSVFPPTPKKNHAPTKKDKKMLWPMWDHLNEKWEMVEIDNFIFEEEKTEPEPYIPTEEDIKKYQKKQKENKFRKEFFEKLIEKCNGDLDKLDEIINKVVSIT